MIPKLRALFILLLACVLLTACNGSVDIYDEYDDEGNLVTRAVISIDSEYAAARGVSANDFYHYVSRLLRVVRFREVDNEFSQPRYIISAVSDHTLARSEAIDEDFAKAIIVSDNGFLRLYQVSLRSPFNGVYDAVNDASAITGPNVADRSIATVLARGWAGEGVYDGANARIELLSFADTFPTLASDTRTENISLRYYFAAGNVVTDGTRVIIDGQSYVLWASQYDDSTQMLTLQYYRPNSLGWNIVAIVAGCLVVLVIVLCTRPRKPKTGFRDIIPYDPYEQGASGTNLPV